MRTIVLLWAMLLSSCVYAAADKGADIVDIPVDTVTVEHKANSVVISQSDEGLRTIFIVIAERKEATDSQTKINALKDAIKQLEVRVDVLKKTKKEEEKTQKTDEKGKASLLETLPGDEVITPTPVIVGVHGQVITSTCTSCNAAVHYTPAETTIVYHSTPATTTVEPDGTVLPDGHIVLNGCRTCWRVHGWQDK